MATRHGAKGGQGGALAPPENRSAPSPAPPLKNMYDRYCVKYQYLAYIIYLSQLNKLRNKLNLLFV